MSRDGANFRLGREAGISESSSSDSGEPEDDRAAVIALPEGPRALKAYPIEGPNGCCPAKSIPLDCYEGTARTNSRTSSLISFPNSYSKPKPCLVKRSSMTTSSGNGTSTPNSPTGSMDMDIYLPRDLGQLHAERLR